MIDPSPVAGRSGDHYRPGTDAVLAQFEEWDVEWFPLGDEETNLERLRFRWRPLGGAVDWLD